MMIGTILTFLPTIFWRDLFFFFFVYSVSTNTYALWYLVSSSYFTGSTSHSLWEEVASIDIYIPQGMEQWTKGT